MDESPDVLLWNRSLTRLQNEFIGASKEYRQSCSGKTLALVLMHLPVGISRKQEDEWLINAAKNVQESFLPDFTGPYDRDTILEFIVWAGRWGENSSRRLFSTLRSATDLTLWDTWSLLMKRAGYLLYNSPKSVLDRFENEIKSARAEGTEDSDDWEENAWIWSMFDLAATMPRNVSLRAERRLVLPGGTDVVYDCEAVRRISARFKSDVRVHQTLCSWSEKLPDAYFAFVHDAYLSSADFIDWLILEGVFLKTSPATPKTKKRGRPRKSPLDEDWKRDHDIFNRWLEAYSKGVTKAQFAKSAEIMSLDLNESVYRIIDRHRKRVEEPGINLD